MSETINPQNVDNSDQTSFQKLISKNMLASDEPISNPEKFRATTFPINPKYQRLWDSYKTQQSSFWIASEIDFSSDYNDYIKLTENEQNFIKMVLAFFASADNIISFGIQEKFLKVIMPLEIRYAYSWQIAMENIHSEIYSLMLNNIIKDKNEQELCFNAIKTIEPIKNMAEWAFKWIESELSIGHLIIANTIIEGVFFSGAFASIFWLKKQRGEGTLFMEGLVKSNRFIARDESLHLEFGCELYKEIVNRVPSEDVELMFYEANQLSKNFVEHAIQCRLIGMNMDLMNQYINYVSDRVLVSLGYDKMYYASNPFEFMDTISLHSKDNFFETRPDSYQKAYNETNTNRNWILLDEF